MIHLVTASIAVPLISALLVAAAWSDFAIREIPNWCCLAILAIGLLARLGMGMSIVSVSTAMALCLLVFLMVLHALGLLGGGDVKLAAAVALCLPAVQILEFVEFTALFGGVLAIFYIAARRIPYKPKLTAPKATIARVLRVELHRIRRGGPLPYGVALAAAGIFVLAGA